MLQEFKTDQQKRLFTDMFFSNDKDFLCVAIGKKENDGVGFSKTIYNDKFFC